MRMRIFFIAVAVFSASALLGQAAAQQETKKFEIPKEAIKGTVKSVDQDKRTFIITQTNKKDRTFTVGKNTEFWGPKGGDRGTGPAGLKDDCMAAGYEIQVVAAKDAKFAKDVYLPDRKTENAKANAKPKEPTAAQIKIAKNIAGGHAYQKHVIDEKLFPEVKSETEFIAVIAKVLANPTHHRGLENDREAYYDIKSNTIIVYNPHARDNGTCFRPRDGLKYYENLK